MRTINKILLHCSDSDRPEHDNINVIRSWHLKRGFNDVGYHYYIRKDGVVEVGRTLDKIGAHAKGYNADSIGICLGGRDNFTSEQFKSLKQLLNDLQGRFNIAATNIYGHNHFDKNKSCPNYNVDKFKIDYNIV